MNKENVLFQLDLLQAWFQGRKTRFPRTHQVLKAHKYGEANKNSKSAHRLLQLNRIEAAEKIDELALVAFERKYHGLESKLIKSLIKALKKEKSKISQKIKSNPDDKAKLDAQLEGIDSLLKSKDEGLLKTNARHKLVKILLKLYPELTPNETHEPVPQPEWFVKCQEKENNPYKTNSKVVNDLMSKAFADKEVKKELEIEGFEVIWRRKIREYKQDEEDEDEEGDSDEEEEEDDDEEVHVNNDHPVADEDPEAYFDMYKDAIAASSDEEEDAVTELDPDIDYNQVTDEEPDNDSDNESEDSKRRHEDDDFFDDPSSQPKKKQALPQLATGYYSGGESDEDVDNDKVVQELTTERKNRRGQRARQKIWEKKYGKGAKHVIKNHERDLSERERLKVEYEQRKAKRDVRDSYKAKKNAEMELKRKEQEERASKLGVHHPSWEAKRLAEDRLKNVKFAGKKKTFD